MRRDWLVEIRKKHGLTQEDVAEVVKTSPSHYGDIETGRRTPRPQLAMRIAVFFGFPLDWFFLPSYLHNAELWVLKLAMQMDFPPEDIFLNKFPRIAEKRVGVKSKAD
ncbi:helix-turn-helix domain-containing protein [Bacillus cytotoxicus]|uniref:Helix-turn-helix domain-containing protein n=1 Tax=Bacillus cytotoxicus TaxID=580165 RepID=A0ACC6A764_9BACI|nr:helix-turn-helix domain-containing protein [Bacillus cytotoxicus]